MNTVRAVRGVVVGADHRRLDRPGQDAAAIQLVPDGGVAVAVVCDGCGSTPAAQVGAELGARLFANAVAHALATGAAPGDPDTWAAARTSVIARLAGLVSGLGDRDAAVHDLFLFTVVAAAVAGDTAAVWALGDGAYVLGGAVTQLGPFAENRPPYVGYDLVGEPRQASLVTAPAGNAGVALVATDGAAALDLAALADDAGIVAHPDALRRFLAVRARAGDQIDWAAQRVVRAPALLHDDAAVAILRWNARGAA
jgi:hypothetical protein